ncbi:MAG: hypothetical protein RR048_07445, partial [Oscillospiraceae bacterium]
KAKANAFPFVYPRFAPTSISSFLFPSVGAFGWVVTFCGERLFAVVGFVVEWGFVNWGLLANLVCG